MHSPTYIGFTRSTEEQRLRGRAFPAGEGRERRLADGFRGHGCQASEGKSISTRPCLCNPHNPCGRVWEHWELEKAMELFKDIRRLSSISDEIWSDIILERPQAHPHPVRQRGCPDAHRRLLCALQDLQPGRSRGQLPHRLQPNWWRDRVGRQESSLNHYNDDERPVHARPHRCLSSPKATSGSDELLSRCMSGNVDLCLRLHRSSTLRASRSPSPKAPICSLWTAPTGAPPTARPFDDVEKACWDVGVADPGRKDVPRPLPSADEPGFAPFPHRGSLPPDGPVCLPCVSKQKKGPLPVGRGPFLIGQRSSSVRSR